MPENHESRIFHVRGIPMRKNNDVFDRLMAKPYMARFRPYYNVSAKYSCGFPDPQVLPIIVVDRYLDYFTTIMEDRLWQVLAKPVFRWRNRSGLSMNADRAA